VVIEGIARTHVHPATLGDGCFNVVRKHGRSRLRAARAVLPTGR
jgi:hypothetical protein